MDLFLTGGRPDGDLAGVLEADDESGYFYLYAATPSGEHQVVGSIHLWSGPTEMKAERFAIAWSADGALVALLIDASPWAVFDVQSGRSYGGDFREWAEPRSRPRSFGDS